MSYQHRVDYGSGTRSDGNRIILSGNATCSPEFVTMLPIWPFGESISATVLFGAAITLMKMLLKTRAILSALRM
jgi:hypothetical protein